MEAALTPSAIASHGSRLLGQGLRPGLPGRWQQRRAIALLAKDGSAAAVRAMALALVQGLPDNSAVRDHLRRALGALDSPLQRQVIAEVALEKAAERGASDLVRLLSNGDGLPTGPPEARVAVAMACGWPERLSEDGPEVVAPLLESWSRHPATIPATMALSQLRRQATIDLLCRHWIHARLMWEDAKELLYLHGDDEFMTIGGHELSWLHLPTAGRMVAEGKEEGRATIRAMFEDFAGILAQESEAINRWNRLGKLLLEAGHAPTGPADRVLFWLMGDVPEELAEEGPEILPTLLAIWPWEPGKQQVRQVLLQLRSPATIDALCRHWMETGAPADDLAELLLEARHAPSQPVEQALFWMLSGQTALYDAVDPEGVLLAQTLATASAHVRQGLARASAAAGRTEWLRVMQQGKPLDAFTAEDWATTVDTLTRSGHGEEIWRWALLAPPVQCLALLQALPADTEPPASLGEGARTALELAQTLTLSAEATALLADQGIRVLPAPIGRLREIAWSPDGRYLAISASGQTIQLLDPASGVTLHTLHGYQAPRHSNRARSAGSTGCSLSWSPDGRHLAAFAEDSIKVWNAAMPVYQHTLRDPALSDLFSMAWSPDGRSLATLSRGGIFRVWDGASGACSPLHQDSRVTAVSSGLLAWSADGTTIAAGYNYTSIQLVDVRSGESTLIERNANVINDLVWGPRGDLLATGNGNKVRLWDRASKRFTHTLEGHTESVTGLAWSADGHWLASSSHDQTLRLWDPRSGACVHTLSGQGEGILSFGWSADGRRLASVSQRRILLWDPVDGSCVHALSIRSPRLTWLAWSPQGNSLACAGEEGILLWREDLHDIARLMATPLACLHPHHWDVLGRWGRTSTPWKAWADPWVAFIRALGTLVCRFDVDVDQAAPPQRETPFAVQVDG